MPVMLMWLMSKIGYIIMPEGTKFTGLGKLGLNEGLQVIKESVHIAM